MSILRAWRGWRRFRQLPSEWRNLVFYSESGQDWHQFSSLIEELNSRWHRNVCYITSDPNDPGLSRQHDNFQAIFIPEGLFLTVFFQMNQSDVFVLTMMDLGNLQLKRSVHAVHYVYLFHSMGSTHVVDHADSYDHYDTLFCTGPHQIREIRRREELQNLPAKSLFEFGHPRLEQVLREGREYRLDAQLNKRANVEAHSETHPGSGAAATNPISVQAVVLIAPTWGENSIFNTCGEELIESLLAADFRVIMRPHYHSNRLTPELIQNLRQRFEAHPAFEYIDQMGETHSLFRSDLLISDWSAMALEYCLGLEKPVLFIDVPRRIRNPDWQDWGMEPMESSIRSQAGAIVAPDQLHLVPAKIRELLSESTEFISRMRELRQQQVFNLGHSVEVGAAELVRLADQQAHRRVSPAADHE